MSSLLELRGMRESRCRLLLPCGTTTRHLPSCRCYNLARPQTLTRTHAQVGIYSMDTYWGRSFHLSQVRQSCKFLPARAARCGEFLHRPRYRREYLSWMHQLDMTELNQAPRSKAQGALRVSVPGPDKILSWRRDCPPTERFRYIYRRLFPGADWRAHLY